MLISFLNLMVIILQGVNLTMLFMERDLINRNTSYVVRLIACGLTVVAEVILAIQNLINDVAAFAIILNIVLVGLNLFICLTLITYLADELISKTKKKKSKKE